MTGPWHRVDEATGIVLLFDRGFLDFASWESAVLAALQTLPRVGQRRFLSDRRRLTHPHSLGLIEEIVGFLQDHAQELGDARWALLAEPATAVQESLELGENLALSTSVRVRTFIDIRTALSWLLTSSDEPEIRRLIQWIDGQTQRAQ